jgi:hypothetical protein
MTNVKNFRKEKELKQLIRREHTRETYRKIGKILLLHQQKGLSKIDIPDNRATDPSLGNSEDPSSWKDPWRTITDPSVIANKVIEMNKKQYHQTHKTPFGSGPLATLLARTGNTITAKRILGGNISNLSQSRLPETARVLQTLARD